MPARDPDWSDRLDSLPGWRRGLVLDIRSAVAFGAGHLRGAVSYPLEPGAGAAAGFAALLPSIFLPPRPEPLLVVASSARLAEALAAHLRARGRASVGALGLGPAALAALPPALLERGPSRARLWQPPRWLERHAGLLPPPALGPALDLACGSGRACVWLAEQGWRTTGLDHEPEALLLGGRLAASRAVACRFLAADLRRPEVVPAGPWALVTAFRFLDRPLLARLAGLVVPGGVACVRTFRDAPGYAGHPHPRHRLARGELLRAFPAGRWEVLA
ncbi:MAG: methyltransferase domain-containing protein, partial [Candidatus Krumholzibacteriia bacterium]